jgi:hypothetical protein
VQPGHSHCGADTNGLRRQHCCQVRLRVLWAWAWLYAELWASASAGTVRPVWWWFCQIMSRCGTPKLYPWGCSSLSMPDFCWPTPGPAPERHHIWPHPPKGAAALSARVTRLPRWPCLQAAGNPRCSPSACRMLQVDSLEMTGQAAADLGARYVAKVRTSCSEHPVMIAHAEPWQAPAAAAAGAGP